MTFDALVLAGGTGRRLGGIDKPALLVGGVSLLDRVLLACESAAARVVVGPVRPTLSPVRWVQEEIPFGGPAAGLAAGLEAVSADVIVLLAADLPYLDGATVDRLADTCGLLVAGGKEQWLCGAWRTDQLRSTLAGRPVAGTRLRDLLAPLVTARWHVDDGDRSPWTDVDTPDDLAQARQSGRSSAA